MEHHLLADSEFHYPQLQIDDGELKTRVEAELQAFMVNREKLECLERIFDRECDLGLLGKNKNIPSNSTFLMANTYIPGLYPNGSERGDYLSLDLGSTNFRVLWSTFSGDSDNCETHVRFYDVPQQLRCGECRKLFDFIASCISDFVQSFDKLKDRHSAVISSAGEPLKLGFTFSFPTNQTAIDSAILLTWTKSFDCPDAIGQDVVKLLQDAIDRLQVGTSTII